MCPRAGDTRQVELGTGCPNWVGMKGKQHLVWILEKPWYIPYMYVYTAVSIISVPHLLIKYPLVLASPRILQIFTQCSRMKLRTKRRRKTKWVVGAGSWDGLGVQGKLCRQQLPCWKN